MLKKRIIFTLLYGDGQFMLSRNFRLQRVGNLDWLERHYNFSHISFFVDELVVLDVTRKKRDFDDFCEMLRHLSRGCFMPIAVGGGVRSLDQARELLRSGADKIVVNTPVFDHPEFVSRLVSEFGQQCVVASLDLKKNSEGTHQIWVDSGSRRLEDSASKWIQWILEQSVGELYLNSIDRDGTGQGYDFSILDQLPSNFPIPVILAGGAGNSHHLATGIADCRVDAVATAHLFNFIGDGLEKARKELITSGIELPLWIPPINDQKVNLIQ